MPVYEIIGTNKNKELGSWVIEAKDNESLNKSLLARGLKAKTINGKDVNRVKPAPREDNTNAI